MFKRLLRILTPILLITLVAIALIFIPFDGSSDFDAVASDEALISQSLPEGTFP